MAGHFGWGRGDRARAKAIRSLSAMVGAMVLAREIDDEVLSNEILEKVGASLS